ncbi:rRNA small subunit methyltransferase H [Brachybacterium faecium]|uniref:Ribosomal RNA small subunit methyltransferase H n=1 Tax=Brachybacterium faecium (strain ATCC 43885 / DSM 4810 / JCM 11609 / LMG 19847 / NBRC 14762 / NCIMB 9860 / 6-10) TaxID=446465 RepID=C7MBE8_BRAFD|nr:16S rRNA (cytosine(1402)-N(4))-methyltransferase RsmH [Brachybacterium faecium]ACU84921.1 S-adenosyl-methyltransferase MraW [Brachybacterium faecium DSM 4810]SLN03783.1 rRNA small subunit methyltransferase H [Brachybacterium faecium]
MEQTHSDRPAEQRHVPVLLDTSVQLLAPALQDAGAVHVDATLGMGGHAAAVLHAAPRAHLVGIDRDPQALALARERLDREGVGERATLVHATYDQIPEVLEDLGLPGAHGVMMDLGLSSFQIDTADRGFSYAVDAPLDMRMDTSSDGPTAADLLRDLPEAEIARILRDLGDERFAKRIARRVVQQRESAPLTRSGELVALLERAIPAASKASGGHPAKRTFQALRIAVNEELEILASALESALDCVHVGGRIVVESYHSGEDRLVKTAFTRRIRSSAPPGLPVELEEHKPTFSPLVRGALQADEHERGSNSRAASVRLRALTRTRPAERAH